MVENGTSKPSNNVNEDSNNNTTGSCELPKKGPDWREIRVWMWDFEHDVDTGTDQEYKPLWYSTPSLVNKYRILLSAFLWSEISVTS